MTDPAIQQYMDALEQARQARPPRQYEHPIVIIGCGMGGVSVALDLQQRGRQDFVLVDRMCAWGGSTWNDVANTTTKLQTEKATYHPQYLNFLVPVDPSLKTWPSKDSIQQMIERTAEEAGLDAKAHLGCDVQSVRRHGDPLAGGRYTVRFGNDEGGVSELAASAVVACVAECKREWEAYIELMKRQGQIAADAEEIPYPYTVKIVDELIGDSAEYWRQEATRRAGA